MVNKLFDFILLDIYLYYSSQANIVTEELKISQKLHSSMIGPGGKLILSITAECGDVNIRFPQDNATSDIITIRGTKEDVDKAKVSLLIQLWINFLMFI